MTKGQIHFSNDLNQLLKVLKENLHSTGAPFDRRMVVVPHLGLKNFIMRSLAKDPDLQVAAGLEIVNVSQAFGKMVKSPPPTTLELSLFLQHALIPLIEKEPELRSYFNSTAKEERIGPFCDTLAQIFQRYGVYGHSHLSTWQKNLWDLATKAFKFPHTTPVQPIKGQLHVFGSFFIPQIYFKHYLNQGAHLYLFSPCEIFWGDFYSEKEKQWLQKEMAAASQDLFVSSFEDQNSLLANWGKVGRKMFIMAEESGCPTQEHYKEPSGPGCLSQIQSTLLLGSFSKPKNDESVQCQQALSRFHEIETLKQILLKLLNEKKVEPHQIQVLAPDISLYFSSVEALFSDIPYEISDLELIQLDPVAKAFKNLIALVDNRFSTKAVLSLLQAPAFREKFDLDPSLIERWLEAAHIKWGFSRDNPIGTWEWGLKRLLLGLGDPKGVMAISVTEMEMFNRLYLLLHSLADDLAVLHDQTKWTISTWIRYFCALLESYFVIDPTEDLYQSFQRYAIACDELDQEEVTFTSMQRIIDQILHQKTKISSSANLQAINFASLSEGAIRPCKVLCLIGMDEETFPRQEQKSSLLVKEQDYHPSSQDMDRFLFLQALMTPEERFYISYVQGNSPSPFVQELFDSIEDGEITSSHSYHPPFVENKAPLIPSFYEPIQLPKASPLHEINIQKLFKFARHPLRYYLHEVLGIYPERDSFTEGEFVLNPLTKIELAKRALHKPLDEVLNEAKERGELPADPLIPLAREQVAKELENWQLTLDTFGIFPEQIQTKIVKLQVGSTQLQGKLELFTPQGLLVRGQENFEDKIRFWPQALIMRQLGSKVILLKDQKILEPSGSLEEYLDYFALSQHICSPLIPELAKSLLEGGDLKKALKKLEDEAYLWLVMRDGTPSAKAIFDNWARMLSQVFGGISANI